MHGRLLQEALAVGGPDLQLVPTAVAQEREIPGLTRLSWTFESETPGHRLRNTPVRDAYGLGAVLPEPPAFPEPALLLSPLPRREV